jgi:hypothetical protein
MAIEVDKETLRDKILINAMPVIGSLATAGMVAAASAILKKLSATNVTNSTLAGNQNMAPTSQDVAMSGADINGAQTNAAMAADTANASTGNIAAADTEAKVQGTGAEASNTATRAVGLEQGALSSNAATLNMN